MDANRMQGQGRGKQRSAPQVRVNQEADPQEDEYDDVWPTRMPSSARRYQGLADVKTEVGRASADALPLATRASGVYPVAGRKTTIPPRSSATQGQGMGLRGHPNAVPAPYVPDTEDVHLPDRYGGGENGAQNRGKRRRKDRSRSRFHWLFFVGLAMLTMMLGWVLLSTLTNWWQITLDDWHYGRPRTFQTDAIVGHNDSPQNPSHFLALNLNRHIEIIEFPGGDASKAKIYLGPTLVGQGQDLAVVTLEFKDVNGDGKADMLVNIQDSRFVFINENGSFRAAHPGEVT